MTDNEQYALGLETVARAVNLGDAHDPDAIEALADSIQAHSYDDFSLGVASAYRIVAAELRDRDRVA